VNQNKELPDAGSTMEFQIWNPVRAKRSQVWNLLPRVGFAERIGAQYSPRPCGYAIFLRTGSLPVGRRIL
jgi:hypothetical protein